MKRLIFLLAICLIGFAGMSKGIVDNQRTTLPDVVSIDQSSDVISLAIHTTTVIDYVDLPFTAIVPALAIDYADFGTFVRSHAVIKPPGAFTNQQATANLCRFNKNARNWLTHRSHLSQKISFLLRNVIVTSTPFD